MSNNPFLKSCKETNNRFQLLNTDNEIDVKQIKKDKKVISKYNATDNSFTKPSVYIDNRRDDLRRDDLRRDDLRRDDLRRDYRKPYNNFNNGPKKEPIKKPIFDITNEYFPAINSPKDELLNTIQPPNSNFKDILNTQILPKTIPFQDHIEPGWVKISKSKTNNEIIWTYGPSTEYQTQLKKQERLDNDINYCMNRGIEKMKQRWEKYKEEYDAMNGEGSYDEKYKLSSFNDTDYVTDDDNDDDDDFFNDNDDDNDLYSKNE